MKKLDRADYTLLIFLLAMLIFNSPLNNWWAALALPWYSMFVPWLSIIALLAWNHLRQSRGD